MDHSPEITEKPSLTNSSSAPSASPSIGVEPVLDNVVTLTVARAESTILGHVIVTFAKKGSLTCQDLLKCKTTFELLTKAEQEGVSISEPALLATIDDNDVARTVYITPKPDHQFRDFAVWIGMVTETLANLKATQVGLYLCKESLDGDIISDLVSQVVRSLVDTKGIRDICLVVGRHAYNEVLSTALTLKHELDGTQASVHVLH